MESFWHILRYGSGSLERGLHLYLQLKPLATDAFPAHCSLALLRPDRSTPSGLGMGAVNSAKVEPTKAGASNSAVDGAPTPALEQYFRRRAVEEAFELAQWRDNFYWCCGLAPACSIVAVTFARRTAQPLYYAVIPVSAIVTGFCWDSGFGFRHARVREEAGRILSRESGRFIPPTGNGLIDPEEYRNLYLKK